MKKKLQKSTAKKVAVLSLRKETLRDWVTGGGRLRVPVGVADDTTPIYSWIDDTNG